MIHHIHEAALARVQLAEEYSVLRTLGEGCFARVILANHRRTDTTVVLKAIHTEMTVAKDFHREFHYSYHLSPHPNILSVFNVAFRCDDFFVFAEEFAPCGDLAGNVKAGGMSEECVKKIAQQLASALDFIHSKELVHRDLKLENVLVFAPDMSKVKLCDFGATRRDGSLVSKVRCTWHQFVPPEICEVVWNERYHCRIASDVWQLGIIIYVCMTGHPPWQSANSITDPAYTSFLRWHKRRTAKIPTQFKRFSARMLRMFKRLFDHKVDRRAKVTEVNKYLKDAWLSCKAPGGVAVASTSVEWWRRDSDARQREDDEEGRRARKMNSFGLEATVDQKVVSKRIWEWVLSCDSYSGGGGEM